MAGQDARSGPTRRRAGDGPLLVGVEVGGSSARLARCAAEVAERLGVELVVLHVDQSRGRRPGRPDDVALPVDPDLPDGLQDSAAARLRDEIGRALEGLAVRWRWEERCGEAAHVLAATADEIGAACIVVGAPRAGPLRALLRLVEGSVEAELERYQARPVLVVP